MLSLTFFSNGLMTPFAAVSLTQDSRITDAFMSSEHRRPFVSSRFQRFSNVDGVAESIACVTSLAAQTRSPGNARHVMQHWRSFAMFRPTTAEESRNSTTHRMRAPDMAHVLSCSSIPDVYGRLVGDAETAGTPKWDGSA